MREKLQAAHVVVGPDFCFGHERRGNGDVKNNWVPDMVLP